MLEKMNEELIKRLKAHAAFDMEFDSTLQDAANRIKALAGAADSLYEALKVAAAYWEDWHTPCVYAESIDGCDVCPVIETVREAISVYESKN